MALEFTSRQLELLRSNGLYTRLDPSKNYYEWQCAWNFLWSALYHGWLDDDREGREDAQAILKSMARARAEVSARERGLEVGEVALLAPLQEELLVSLKLRAVIYTGMPNHEWRHIYDSLLEALRSVDVDYLFEGEYSYIQLCFDIRHAMEKAKRYAEQGEVARIVDHLMEHKREVAYAVVTKHDPLGLRPGAPDGEDVDAYIWESGIIGTYVIKRAPVRQASQIIAYVLGRSFGEAIEAWEVEGLARDLLERLPDDLMEPEDFQSFEADVKPLIDRQFAEFEERMPWFVERARERAVSEGRDPDYYDFRCSVHFLASFTSDYGLRKQNAGEIDEPFLELA